MTTEVDVSNPDQTPPTHAAIPIPLFQALTKTLSALPWDQVNQIMAGLAECPQLTILPPDKEPEESQ